MVLAEKTNNYIYNYICIYIWGARLSKTTFTLHLNPSWMHRIFLYIPRFDIYISLRHSRQRSRLKSSNREIRNINTQNHQKLISMSIFTCTSSYKVHFVISNYVIISFDQVYAVRPNDRIARGRFKLHTGNDFPLWVHES